MKKWIWYVVGIIVVVGLASGFFIHYKVNASTYKTSMENGRNEIKNKQYNAAQTNFQKAAKIKPNSMEANNLLSQTSKFVDAENKFKDYDFNGSSASFNDVINYNQGSSILVNRAKIELKVLKQASRDVTRLEKIYNQALQQNKAKEFDASNATLDGIFDDDLASNSFYAPIVKEAKKLKDANDDNVVLSKYKVKKTSTDSNSDKKTKPKKTKKITKATKETSSAIDAVTSTVVPAAAYDSGTTTSNADTSVDTTPTTSSQTSTPASESSSSDSTRSSNNYQPASPDPVEHHHDSSTDYGSGSTSDSNTPNSSSKPDSSSSQGNSNTTSNAPAQGNSVNNGTSAT